MFCRLTARRGSPAPHPAPRGRGIVSALLLAVIGVSLMAVVGLPETDLNGGADRADPSGVARAPAPSPSPAPSIRGESLPDPEEQFARASRLYEEGRFTEAARAYQEVVDRGLTSPDLFFNLANALLKSGELGEAIVYYERARAMDPRASDIRANLTYARSLVADVMPEAESSAFLESLVRFRDSISADEILRVAAILLWLVAGAAATARLGRSTLKRVARAVALASLLALGLTGALAAIKVYETAGHERAVLVVPEAAVRAGPGDSYSSRFSLHEGTAVKVERQASGWTEIQLTPTLSGWVPSGALMDL